MSDAASGSDLQVGALGAMPLPVYLWARGPDRAMRLVDFNPAARQATGGRVVQLLGQAAADVYADEPAIVRELHACADEQRVVRRTMPYRMRTSGGQRHFDVTYAPMGPDAVLVYTVDRSEQVAQQSMLARLRAFDARLLGAMGELLRLGVEQLEEGLTRVIDALVVGLNLNACAVAVCSEDWETLTFLHAWSGEGVPPVPATFDLTAFVNLAHVLRRGEPWTWHRGEPLPAEAAQADLAYLEMPALRAAAVIPFSVEGRPLHALLLNQGVDPYGLRGEVAQRLGFLARMLGDLLSRALLEDERRRLEAQYRQAQRMEAIGELTGGVAHEFNNELAVIQLELGQAVAASAAGRPVELEGLKAALRAARRSATTTRHLLGFSRRGALEPRGVDLGALVAQLEPTLRRWLPDRIALQVSAESAPAMLDPHAVEQVVLNLVHNARDAISGPGRVELGVGAEGEWVNLTVRDDGAGMSADVQARAFEPFYTTKRPGRGTGLGLAVAYGVVQQLHGTLSINSALGEGTTVHLSFPRVAPVRVQPSSTRPPELAPPVDSQGLVLLVDDQAALRRAGARALSRQGYEVLAAAGVQDGLRLFRAHRTEVCLTITDATMPDGGGAALIQAIRALDPETPILLTSGHAPPDLDALMARHRVAFVPKPWSLDALLGAVAEALS